MRFVGSRGDFIVTARVSFPSGIINHSRRVRLSELATRGHADGRRSNARGSATVCEARLCLSPQRWAV
jgi:hypothetical protein